MHHHEHPNDKRRGDEHHHHNDRGHILYCPNDDDCPVIDPVIILGDDTFRTRYGFGPADHNIHLKDLIAASFGHYNEPATGDHVHDWQPANQFDPTPTDPDAYCSGCGLYRYDLDTGPFVGITAAIHQA